jgi:hypothetical protein
MATAAAPVTRKDSEVWLIGQPITKIEGRKLPSKSDVLRRLFHLIRTDGHTVRDASCSVMKEVMIFWEMARIPTMADYHVVSKVEKEYEKWRVLQKTKYRRSASQKAMEKKFQEELDDLFDIAHANALQLITIDEDINFLLAQREKGRRGYMAGIDKELADQEERKKEKEEKYKRFREKQLLEEQHKMTLAELDFSCASSEEGHSEEENAASKPKKKKRGRKNIITSDLASALDRTKVSDREAVHILSATAFSLGQDLNECALNRSTIRRRRRENRKTKANSLKGSLPQGIPLIVHFDGKLLPALTGDDKVDRIAVLVSGGGVCKLLGAPGICSGTGKAIAEAVIGCVEEWGIKEQMQGLCFDTTASNTGKKSGACTLIKEKIGRQLLHLPCRHHIMEIIGSSVFTECHKSSAGPNVLIFQRFKQGWKNINRTEYQVIEEQVANREDIIAFCQSQLGNTQPRDDYRELLELTIIYLGGMLPAGVRFMKPGALHLARWMAKMIYSIKICLFRSQFQMTQREITGMQRFAKFSTLVYVRAWFQAPLAVAAPSNDLLLLKQLVRYEDLGISKAQSLHLHDTSGI